MGGRGGGEACFISLFLYLFKSAYVVETWHSIVTVYISKRKTQSLGCSSGTATLTYTYLIKVSIVQRAFLSRPIRVFGYALLAYPSQTGGQHDAGSLSDPEAPRH